MTRGAGPPRGVAQVVLAVAVVRMVPEVAAPGVGLAGDVDPVVQVVVALAAVVPAAAVERVASAGNVVPAARTVAVPVMSAAATSVVAATVRVVINAVTIVKVLVMGVRATGVPLNVVAETIPRRVAGPAGRIVGLVWCPSLRVSRNPRFRRA